MSMVFQNKKSMSEEDIKNHFITPAIDQHWKNRYAMEAKITDGKILLRGNMATRQKPLKADYLLYLGPNQPIAVVEAKKNTLSVSYGLQQAKEYAQKLDLKFAYSSNGDGFEEYDFLTGRERTLSLKEFPSPEELQKRYCAGANGGQGLNETEKKIIAQPYYSSQTTFPPRYYQRIAIERSLDAIARGQKRLLLVMATGTGKTYTAFQIVYWLLKSGTKKKILYLADRNILVDQSIEQDFAPLANSIHKINFSKDDKNTISSYPVYFALYQQGGQKEENGDETEDSSYQSHFSQWFAPDFFDLIIVDECHRGSAKEESRWRKILDYFSSATQIGMTATPKETKEVSNIDYFGEPVYTYSLKEGIEDGFLAPFKVINVTLSISNGWRPMKGQRDIFGNEIEDRIYNDADYDYKIVLQSRIEAVARAITDYLKATDRMQKTIVFCASEEAAERMRIALTKQNQDMMQKYPDYCVRITGSDTYGKGKLDYFISVSSPTPVIATTSELLSTGADCKMTKLIVLDKVISSMTSFKQIIGRGTRIREKDGKTHFTVMDFRHVTRLFADPEWDGEVEQVEGFTGGVSLPVPKPKPDKPGGQIDPKPIVDENGCPVKIVGETISIYDTDGKLLHVEDVISYTKQNVLKNYASLQHFIRHWKETKNKTVIREAFRKLNIDLKELKKSRNMGDVDDFDFICYIVYGQKPLTRKERAEQVRKKDFFSKYSGTAKEVLEMLLDTYKNDGIYALESRDVLKLADFSRFGKPSRIAGYFGGKAGYEKAVQEMENELYEDGRVS